MNCKDGEKFLKESLDCIINQTYKNWELIFVDNASKDNSKSIFLNYNDYRFKYIYINNQVNLGSARQIALKNCSGDFVSFLDTDDLWYDEKLEKQIELFNEDKIGMVISNTIFFSETKKKIFYSKAPPTGDVFYDLLKNYYISLETLMCKKKYLDQLDFEFDKEYSMISDMDLTLRLSLVCKLAYYPKVLSQWRVHKTSDTWNKKRLFFSEQLSLIEKLSLIIKDKENKFFLKNKDNFIKRLNFSQIFNYIENENKLEKLQIIKDIFGKKISVNKFLFLIILAVLPFSKFFIKIYRNIFSINP